MEIEKLIEGETYYVKFHDFWMIGIVTLPNNGNNTRDVLRCNATLINSDREFKNDISWCYKSPNRTYRLATELEKHQLQCSISANRYVDAVEAMLSFVPKYFEAVESSIGYTIGKVYKTINRSTSQWYRSIDDNDEENGWGDTRFKPSTKEAYDAQFSIKVEKLPRFKVIKNIGQLPSVVENDEGNEFRIGDVVTTTEGPNKGKAITIIKFRYTKFRDNICAITDIHRPNGIGIHKLEHVIVKDQPVVEVIEETLLEKANRLYPIGTIYINTTGNRKKSQGNVVDYNDGSNNIMLCSGHGTGLIYKNGRWAKIIK